MWRPILIAAAALMIADVGAGAAQAQSLLETNQQARQRQSAERWQQYEQRGYQAPLGGYSQSLGELAQPGADWPGYTSAPGSYGQSSDRSYGQPYGLQDDQRW